MRCPFCQGLDTAVIDSRASQDGFSIRRRRSCAQCGKRFTTFERVELNMPFIIKRTGDKREYDRDKVRASMKLALRKRPVTNERLEEAIGGIEHELRTLGEREVPSSKVGELVLRELKKLDLIAYVRFASVYLSLDSPAAFEQFIKGLIDPAQTGKATAKSRSVLAALKSGNGS